MNLTDDQIFELLDEIDTIARDYDSYEFGLPFDKESSDKYRKLIRNWINTLNIE